MKTSSWFLGIDLGTGSCKTAAVDENGKVLGFGVGQYSGAEAPDRWQEQDPRDLVEAAIASVRQAVGQAVAEPGELLRHEHRRRPAQRDGSGRTWRSFDGRHHLGGRAGR